jgi:(p)ppGpp synthase/HD superfamily hydrolase
MHDILEDVNPSIYSKNDMLNDFGETVVRIVEGVTKDSSLNSWKEISDAYLANLEKASDKSLIVSAADKTHNLKSMLIDYQTIGQKLWDKFSSDKESQLWWYESTLKIFQKKIPNNKLTVELDKLVIELQKIVEISL